jgi:hypothetical protein
MASLSSSPKILKGAFVRFDPKSPRGRIIVFQYNPEKIYRKLEAHTNGHFPTQSPREMIELTLMLDATDDLEFPDQHQDTVEYGIYPLLSALEMLLYPHNSNKALRSFLGTKRPSRNDTQSLTLLIWGNNRIMPVLVTELHIKEEMFDPVLNPIRATINVRMRALNDSDLSRKHKGYNYWKSHMSTKMAMAKLGYVDRSVDSLKDPK